MFGKAIVRGLLAVAALLVAGAATADTFGTGANQFNIDFVPISGATNPTDTSPSGGYGIVNYDYRMGTYEITNDQWNKFQAGLGVPVTGSETGGYGYSNSSCFTGLNQPTDSVSWYEAAQFVNWLNTSTGNQPAYKFTGTQGTGDYTFALWSPSDAGYDASNPHRNKAAKYFLPTDDEWVKAAYWNGTTLQFYATKGDVAPTQGNGTSGTGWNYYYDNWNYPGPWNVGSGSQELNGTYDMMGNDWELLESPLFWWCDTTVEHAYRGGCWCTDSASLAASYRIGAYPYQENMDFGFRVASVPEPGSAALLAGVALTALFYLWRKRA